VFIDCYDTEVDPLLFFLFANVNHVFDIVLERRTSQKLSTLVCTLFLGAWNTFVCTVGACVIIVLITVVIYSVFLCLVYWSTNQRTAMV